MKILITEKRIKFALLVPMILLFLFPISLVLSVLHLLALQRAVTIFINISFKPMLGVFVKNLLGTVLPIKL